MIIEDVRDLSDLVETALDSLRVTIRIINVLYDYDDVTITNEDYQRLLTVRRNLKKVLDKATKVPGDTEKEVN